MKNAKTPLPTEIRTYIVAGGAGFLGSHLCDALILAGHAVLCVDNFQTGSHGNLRHLMRHPRFDVLRHDICEPLETTRPVHGIFNLACAASPVRYQADPVHTMMTSVLGVKHLLDLAAAKGARFVQASTSEVYGDPERHPQPETYWGNVNPTGPRACYDEGKRAAESLCFDYLRLRRADVRVMRIFNTYGPRMQPDDGRIVSNLVTQALKDQPLTIYGSGEQTRSFCHVRDLVDGIVRLMEVEQNPGKPINLGNPGEFTINELAALVLEITGARSTLVYEPLPVDDPQKRRPDIGLANTLLGWVPRIALAEGLTDTIEWFSRAARAPDPAPMRTAAGGRSSPAATAGL